MLNVPGAPFYPRRELSNPKILAMVMAGGEGKRLYPLTCERSKPSVPFSGRYRIVDLSYQFSEFTDLCNPLLSSTNRSR